MSSNHFIILPFLLIVFHFFIYKLLFHQSISGDFDTRATFKEQNNYSYGQE